MDLLKYNGPVIAISDNTKLKERLGYSSLLGCIVGSTLPLSQTYVTSHDDIYTIIDQIKENNAIATQVHVYLCRYIKLFNFFI